MSHSNHAYLDERNIKHGKHVSVEILYEVLWKKIIFRKIYLQISIYIYIYIYRPRGKETTEVRKSQIKRKESENSYQELKRSPKDRHTQTHGNCIEIF